MEIFDDQQTRSFPALMIEDAGHDPLPPMASRAAIHRFVDGPQLRRLRQVEQIIEEHSIVYRHHTRGERRCRRGAYRFGIAGDLNAKQATGKRTDRVVPYAAAEIEHERNMTRKPDLGSRPLDLLDQARLGEPGFAADIHGLTMAVLAARRQRHLQDTEFGAATDEWSLSACNRS